MCWTPFLLLVIQEPRRKTLSSWGVGFLHIYPARIESIIAFVSLASQFYHGGMNGPLFSVKICRYRVFGVFQSCIPLFKKGHPKGKRASWQNGTAPSVADGSNRSPSVRNICECATPHGHFNDLIPDHFCYAPLTSMLQLILLIST